MSVSLVAGYVHTSVRLPGFTTGNWGRCLWRGLDVGPGDACRARQPALFLPLNNRSLWRNGFCGWTDREDFGATFDWWRLHGWGVVQPGATHVHGWGNDDRSVIGACAATRQHRQAEDHSKNVRPHPHHFEDIHYSEGASIATACRTELAGSRIGSDLLRLIAH